MKPRRLTLLRLLAVVTSASLMAGYVACRSGAMSGSKGAKESTPDAKESPRTVMPGSKSAGIVLPQPSVTTTAPTGDSERAVLPDSKYTVLQEFTKPSNPPVAPAQSPAAPTAPQPQPQQQKQQLELRPTQADPPSRQFLPGSKSAPIEIDEPKKDNFNLDRP